MAVVDLKIEVQSINSAGTELTIKDVSPWTENPDEGSDDVGVVLFTDNHLTGEPTDIKLVPGASGTVEPTWIVPISKDGRITVNIWSFDRVEYSGTPEESTMVPGSLTGDLKFAIHDETFREWTGVEWVRVEGLSVLAYENYTLDKSSLEVPVLIEAYKYRNLINLDYIKKVKQEISHGAQQDQLFYLRTEVDYFAALLRSAEYNWALGLYENFSEITENMNSIINTRVLS